MAEKRSAGEPGEENLPPEDEFPFNLDDEKLEEVLKHPEIKAYLAEKGHSVAQFKAWLRTKRARRRHRKVPVRAAAEVGQKKIKEEAEAQRRAQETESEDDEEFRVEQLRRLNEYAKVAENEAIFARKMADDGAVALEHGTTMPPHSVLEVQRPGPGAGLSTPTVIASGNARVVVSLQQAHRGLRAPGGYYGHYRERIRQMAREFVREAPDRSRPYVRDFAAQTEPSTSETATATSAAAKGKEPSGYGFATPVGEGGNEERTTPPGTRGRQTQGKAKLRIDSYGRQF